MRDEGDCLGTREANELQNPGRWIRYYKEDKKRVKVKLRREGGESCLFLCVGGGGMGMEPGARLIGIKTSDV